MAASTERFALCIRNEGYSASLELFKVYRLISDDDARQRGQMRIIDESGEDYLYPEDIFVPISIPPAVIELLLRAS